MRRSKFLKPELSKNFHSLCSSSVPLPKYLFGDDPSKQVDEISKAIKIRSKMVTKKANSSKRSDRHKPGSRNENRSSGDSFFYGNSRSSGTTRSHQELKDKID